MLKAVHILFGVFLFGLFISEYFYLVLNTRHGRLLRYTLRFSFFMDLLILPLILGLFLSGHFLITPAHFTANTPWIQAAFLLLALITVSWLTILWIKWKNYRKSSQIFRFRWLFHACYWLIALFLIAIIHDAIMKSTVLFH